MVVRSIYTPHCDRHLSSARPDLLRLSVAVTPLPRYPPTPVLPARSPHPATDDGAVRRGQDLSRFAALSRRSRSAALALRPASLSRRSCSASRALRPASLSRRSLIASRALRPVSPSRRSRMAASALRPTSPCRRSRTAASALRPVSLSRKSCRAALALRPPSAGCPPCSQAVSLAHQVRSCCSKSVIADAPSPPSALTLSGHARQAFHFQDITR